MSDPRSTNPYTSQTSAVPGTMPVEQQVSAPAIPDARTQQAFLTQAFIWMFVGLAVTAAIAYEIGRAHV